MKSIPIALAAVACAAHAVGVQAQSSAVPGWGAWNAVPTVSLGRTVDDSCRAPFGAPPGSPRRLRCDLLAANPFVGMGDDPSSYAPPRSIVRLPQASANDSTFERQRVFLWSWGAAAISDTAGTYAILCAFFDQRRCAFGLGTGLLLATTVPIFGTAAGAALGGAPFGRSLAGSAVGLGGAVASLALFGAIGAGFFAFPIATAVHAGITMLIAEP